MWLQAMAFFSFSKAVWSIIPCSGVHVLRAVIKQVSTTRFRLGCQRIKWERGEKRIIDPAKWRCSCSSTPPFWTDRAKCMIMASGLSLVDRDPDGWTCQILETSSRLRSGLGTEGRTSGCPHSVHLVRDLKCWAEEQWRGSYHTMAVHGTGRVRTKGGSCKCLGNEGNVRQRLIVEIRSDQIQFLGTVAELDFFDGRFFSDVQLRGGLCSSVLR